MTISNPQCSFGAKPRYPRFSPLPPSLPLHPPLLRVLLAASASVPPHHPHKRPLPNWFVSASIKVSGHCCPHLPVHILLTPPLLFQIYHGSLLVQFDSAAVLTFPVFRAFQERTQINECEAVNLNEAKCALLYVINSRLTRAEVIQSSRFMFSVSKMSGEKRKITKKECSKMFWLSILAQFAILSATSCMKAINYPQSKRT